MRKFTVTVNGQDYDVVVKDGGAAAAAPAPAAAPKAAPAPAAAPAAMTGRSPLCKRTKLNDVQAAFLRRGCFLRMRV